jgi:hypothetical protein
VFLTDVTFMLGVKLLSGHRYAEFLAKQEYGVQPVPEEILSKNEKKQCKNIQIP